MTSAEQLLADCFDPNSGLIPAHVALERILDALAAVDEIETVALEQANGRVLAEDVCSPMNVPPHANSAMDGYALRSEDLTDQPKAFRLIGKAFAGSPFDGKIGKDETVRIMTGAVLPANADTVIMQERVTGDETEVLIPGGEKAKQNTRAAGEDIKQDQIVVAKGALIDAAALGVLASVGVAELKVKRLLQVALMSTGDELRVGGEPLKPGQIYDSNRAALKALLQNLGANVIDMGIIRDQREAMDEALLKAAERADVIITSGGASTGVADYASEAMRELGELGVWRIALRPGRPFGYGKINDVHFFGLPGNPVAVMTTFYALVQPALRKLMGQTNIDPTPRVKARLMKDLRKKPGRVEYYRARLFLDDEQPRVEIVAGQGSGMLHSMHVANCFIVMAHDDSDAKAGEFVTVHPFDGAF